MVVIHAAQMTRAEWAAYRRDSRASSRLAEAMRQVATSFVLPALPKRRRREASA